MLNQAHTTICCDEFSLQASNAIRAADTEALNWRQARRVRETQAKPQRGHWVKMMKILKPDAFWGGFNWIS